MTQDTRQKRKKPFIFACILILLFTQYTFALTIAEPYPGVVFPAFAAAPKASVLTTQPPPASYKTIALDASGHPIQFALFGGMSPAAKLRNFKRICPLPSDLKKQRDSYNKHHRKYHYKLRLWLHNNMAGGYYKPHHTDVAHWIKNIKKQNSIKTFSVIWMSGNEQTHECHW